VTSVTNATDATGSTDGALVVTGGVGVAKKAFIAGVTSVTNDTDATGSTDGALVVSGGMGVAKKAFIAGVTSVTNDTDASSTTTGALQVLGGLGVVKSIHAADTTFESVNITDNANSTDKDTGALIVQSGGAGIELNLNVGGVTKVWDETDASSTTTGALQVLGGLGVVKSIHAADTTFESVTVTDTTHSTTKDTGAIIVQNGGLGVESNIYATNVFAASHIYANVSTAITSSNVLDIRGTANVGALVTRSVDVTDATGSTSTTTGALTVGGGVGIVENLFVGGTGKIENATDATTTTSGALQVVGGLGVAKTIFAADMSSGSVDVTDTTQATSTTTGALKVAGGISTQTNVHATSVYVSGGLVTNTGQVTKKTYAYSGTISDTEQPYINVCFTNESFSAKITGQLIEGDDEISTITVDCCGGNKNGGATLSASDIQTGSIQVFGPTSTNPWSSTIVTDKKTVALRPSGAIDTSGEYHIFVEYITAKTDGAVSNIVQDTTQKIAFGY
jgi:hypothetical protein